ncbi:alcohol dehydrogenase [Aspergillus heteromorphus CBS 117.55]|uniref:Alcohol dehydrogenase n=1 Tax=Aspergillus heteromorphus CBS 117.55 TaxID=1448321 RepID=A0A317WGE0_9EURO|nr:alcohol dehydrogenase [Aspergillus heteromorphus CBS 117.55]PWY85045.1 alcohol dehydrogenase [Aspergillus heteromorphus CBS 117.55]
MKAIQLTRSSSSASPTISLVTMPTPNVPQGHALVQILYSYIHPSDKLNARGLYPTTTFPRVPGRDYSGIVVDITSDRGEAKGWIGKEVYGSSGSALGYTSDGPHAQYFVIPVDALVEKPSSLSVLQAATVGVPYATALLCLRRAQTRKEDVVLAMGCQLVLSAGRRADPSLDVLLESEDVASTLQSRIPDLTGQNRVDVVIDTVGNIGLMSAAISQLAVGGRYAWIAAPRGDVSKKSTVDIFQAYRKAIQPVGCNSNLPTMVEVADELRLLGRWFDEGLLKVADDRSFSVVALADAIEQGYTKTAGGRVVIGMA